MKLTPKHIDVARLRRSLFGVDRLPVLDHPVWYRNIHLFHYYTSIPALTMDLVLRPQGEVPGYYHGGKPKHRSAHRLLAICTCGREIPVGRLAQHKH